MVEVNDTGIDATHPDLLRHANRVFRRLCRRSLVDTDGHGTHRRGQIAGNGTESTTVTDTPQVRSIRERTAISRQGAGWQNCIPSAAFLASGNDTNAISDSYLQAAPALTNALISNNSWEYDGDNAYDLAAASYDAAVRDALPEVTGSQPVLFVFAAGNDGGGDETIGGGGSPDTIVSPATAKNVITVGALEQLRNITNIRHRRRTAQFKRSRGSRRPKRLSGGRIIQPRQRGHRHGRRVWAIQAGRGRAGIVCRLDALASNGTTGVLQPDEFLFRDV